MESMTIGFTDVNGNNMKTELKNVSNISVLQTGYLITPDGLFLEVKDVEEHNVVFSEYLNDYFCKREKQKYDSTEAILELCNQNHIVYCGARANDYKNDARSCEMGKGWFFLPSPIENITEDQKKAICALLDTNCSYFRKEKLVDIYFGELATCVEHSEDDMLAFINCCKK